MLIKVHEMKARKELWPETKDLKMNPLVDYEPFSDAVESYLRKYHKVIVGITSASGKLIGEVNPSVNYRNDASVMLTTLPDDVKPLFDGFVKDMRNLGYKVREKEDFSLKGGGHVCTAEVSL